MASSFDYRQNSSLVSWKQTILYNLLRMAVGGVIVALVVWAKTKQTDSLSLISMPLIWLLIGLPAWMICQKLPQKQGGIAALFLVLPFLIVGALADPLIYAVSKIKPDILPVKEPKLMEFSSIVFLLKDQ